MVKGYSRTQIALHWVVGIIIILQLVFGESMADVYRAVRQSATAEVTTAAWAHIILGGAVLVLVLWRLALRLSRGAPPVPPSNNKLLELAGKASHWVLYAGMIVAPITGFMAWYGGIEAAGELHEASKPLFILLIALHLLAALYHQFVLKDGLMDRMRKVLD